MMWLKLVSWRQENTPYPLLPAPDSLIATLEQSKLEDAFLDRGCLAKTRLASLAAS